MTDELKPVKCGCGGEAVILYIGSPFSPYIVKCKKCGVRTDEEDTEAEAVETWNRAMGIAEKSSTVERTAKVDELCGKWGKCECGADVFRPDTEGWKYCPYCGARLEWE